MVCLFCLKSDGIPEVKQGYSKEFANNAVRYECPRCGKIYLSREAYEDFSGTGFSEKQKNILSICLRNESDKITSLGLYGKPLKLSDLNSLVDRYREKDPIEKMDITLQILGHSIKNVSDNYMVNYQNDYPLFHCINPGELMRLIEFLHDYQWIKNVENGSFNAAGNLFITPKGYEKLRDLKRINVDSRQCFVAMWFSDELMDVYDKAIKPAIEYTEDGDLEPRFKALLISQKEHTNDINDEIISEIRRSRFMICDLTGYRGGVYWEAGFAYGLGLEVFYTCKEDWVNSKDLDLYDKDRKKVSYKQEGIHFDLEHRNRISWSPNDLPKFKEQLTNRIKAIIA
jgi:nucleoside 2-deoxyribosyltransferase